MTSGPQRLELRIDEQLLNEIDDWRSKKATVLSRSEAVRTLISKGLAENNRPIFELMRAQIISLGLGTATQNAVANSYLFAWQHRVFPFFDDSPINNIFEQHFSIGREKIDDLTKHLDNHMQSNTVPTFYELEDHYGVKVHPSSRWTRTELLLACRYACLDDRFGDEFWQKVLAPMQHPSEAQWISRPFNRSDDVYFS